MSDERLLPADRERVVADLLALRLRYPKLALPKELIAVYAHAARSRPTTASSRATTTTISADLKTRITPCQFGGAPDCSNCGCIASAGLAAVARHRVFGVIPGRIDLLNGSIKVGERDAASPSGRVAGRDAIIRRILAIFTTASRKSDRRGNSSAG